MTRWNRALRIGLAVTLLSTAALALTASDGYVATPVFSLTDAQPYIAYADGFAGVEWNDMDNFALGPLTRTSGVGEEAALAEGANGETFALVYGMLGTDDYTGIIAFDGSGCSHVIQNELLDVNVPYLWRAGGNLRAITVSPVTAGLLTAGHVVAVRTWRDEGKYVPGGDSGDTWLELLDIDPDTGSSTVVHSWLCTINANARLTVDSDGTIYALQIGVLDTTGDPTGPEVRKLVWNGSDYDDSLLVADVEGGVLLGPDGYVYTFADHSSLGWSYADGTKPQILKVDPDTGATTNFAQVDGRSFIHDWAFDSAGKLRIALEGARSKKAISTVAAGGTASASKGAIASWTGDFVNIVPHGEGGLSVAEALFGGDADISTLAPDSSGGGGGGGGKGGGKGKNK